MPAAAGPHPLAAQRPGRTAAHGSAADRIAGLAGQFQMGLGFLGVAPQPELDG